MRPTPARACAASCCVARGWWPPHAVLGICGISHSPEAGKLGKNKQRVCAAPYYLSRAASLLPPAGPSCSVVLSYAVQLAASDAAVHGWPPSTLVPLLQHMAAAYNQELIPLLAKPLVLALQQQRQEVVGAVMDVLEEEAALDQGDLLADALLLLAYQVGLLMVLGPGGRELLGVAAGHSHPDPDVLRLRVTWQQTLW